jgi:hypothetical protein
MWNFRYTLEGDGCCKPRDTSASNDQPKAIFLRHFCMEWYAEGRLEEYWKVV